MFGRARILVTIAACVLAVPPAAAQAPAPTTTAFDGTYVGTGTEARAHFIVACATIASVHMAITGGQVVIHEFFFTGSGRTYRGSVNAAGELSALYQTPTIDILSGTIHDKVFAGQHQAGHYCHWNIQMTAAPTMPFNGDYVGVSRELSNALTASGTECTPNGVPAPLTISGGAVWSDAASWGGTVSPQGALTMRDRRSTWVDGQIENQGIIRGQGRNAAGCTFTYIWRKRSG